MSAPTVAPGLALRLREVQVGLRADLETARIVFRGEVAYVVRDPLTLGSHRLGIEEYQVLVALRPDRTLGEICAELVRQGRIAPGEEESFYVFVFQLHRLGFLALPLSDEKMIYKRAQAKREQKRTKWLTAFFYYPVPLCNPDAFLRRTAIVGRVLFSWPAFFVWLAVVALAAFVALRNQGEFSQPLGNIFSNGNLPLLWITLIGLKVFHEFGHAYATRRFGGSVPEMGVNLVMFTPAAYMDASSSWTFPKHSQRLLVCLAGMYVELFLAALALLAWSVLEPGLARNLAHNVVLLASLVTIGFNANPLTRYDGYFALSDLLQIPNLHQRASQYIAQQCKRLFLGLRTPGPHTSVALGIALAAFGISASIYRLLLVTGISAAIASRYYSLGILLALVYFGRTLLRFCTRVFPYLWSSKETGPIRRRAIAVGLGVFGLGPLLCLCIPLPARVLVPGAVTAEREFVVRSATAGVLAQAPPPERSLVGAGRTLARLEDPALELEVEQARARVRAIQAQERDSFAHDPNAARGDAERLESAREELRLASERLDALDVRSTAAGTLVHSLDERELGRYLPRGSPIATLSAGEPRVRAILSQDEFVLSRPLPGQPVAFRPAGDPAHAIPGRVTRVVEGGTRELDAESLALAEASQGTIALDARQRSTERAHFEVVVALDRPLPLAQSYGSTGVLRMPARREFLGELVWRKLLLFTHRLRAGT
ncbi:MAG: hypothetical protein IPJ19_02780 [Planctomycetes bacterium]|nr:hypothetical protein [Planctomycetota bacterium]